MKRNKYHIIQTWMLLLCFAAGQYMVYAHRHVSNISANRSAYSQKVKHPQQTITENCQLCDAMHHNTMATNSPVYFASVVVSSYFYKAISHDLISLSLIHAAGRSPPTA